jgi:hypothetical protein
MSGGDWDFFSRIQILLQHFFLHHKLYVTPIFAGLSGAADSIHI